MSKHTPGPWYCHVYGELIEIHDEHQQVIVSWAGFDGIDTPHKVSVANANLIATAPDLLETLKAAMKYIDLCVDGLLKKGGAIYPGATGEEVRAIGDAFVEYIRLRDDLYETGLLADYEVIATAATGQATAES